MNIEEVGCKPIKIGELYGGGNLAGYSVYGYDNDGKPKESGSRLYGDPQVNVKSFTSIGDIYGGGYGNSAIMVGNPTVNINEAYGRGIMIMNLLSVRMQKLLVIIQFPHMKWVRWAPSITSLVVVIMPR